MLSTEYNTYGLMKYDEWRIHLFHETKRQTSDESSFTLLLFCSYPPYLKSLSLLLFHSLSIFLFYFRTLYSSYLISILFSLRWFSLHPFSFCHLMNQLLISFRMANSLLKLVLLPTHTHTNTRQKYVNLSMNLRQ